MINEEYQKEKVKELHFKNYTDTFNFINDFINVMKAENQYFRWENNGKDIKVWINNEDNLNGGPSSINLLFEELLNKYGFSESDLQKKDFEAKFIKKQKHLKLYADGGSRGNPGPSSSGYVILDEEDNIIVDKGVYLGVTTNNQAEYTALKLGLEHCLTINANQVDVFMDSLLVINQMLGIFKVRNRDLWPIHDNIKEIITKFKKVHFQHIPRELNKLADAAVNRALDEELSRKI